MNNPIERGYYKLKPFIHVNDAGMAYVDGVPVLEADLFALKFNFGGKLKMTQEKESVDDLVLRTLAEKVTPNDMVNRPSHYASGKIEVIEAIEDWNLNFNRGNCVKYCARAGKKNPDKEVEDLEKAIWYLNREIEIIKSRKEGRDPRRPKDMAK